MLGRAAEAGEHGADGGVVAWAVEAALDLDAGRDRGGEGEIDQRLQIGVRRGLGGRAASQRDAATRFKPVEIGEVGGSSPGRRRRACAIEGRTRLQRGEPFRRGAQVAQPAVAHKRQRLLGCVPGEKQADLRQADGAVVGRVAWGGEEFERQVAAVDDEDVVKEDGRRDEAHACVFGGLLGLQFG